MTFQSLPNMVVSVKVINKLNTKNCIPRLSSAAPLPSGTNKALFFSLSSFSVSSVALFS